MADANYKHDVFISYRWVWPDRPWVRERLAPALERAGLKVWLEVSKSAPACDLYEETETAINDSRKALCVISPAYLREIEKNARMVAVEFRIFQRLSQSDKNRVVPLLLRGRKIPTGIHHLKAHDWRKCRDVSQEWEKLLDALGAKDRKTAPPSMLDPCLKRVINRTGQVSGVALAVIAVTWVIFWFISQIPPIPQLSIKTIGGEAARSEMLVTPSGSLTGDSDIDVPPKSNVFVYLQRKGGTYDKVWQCVGSSAVNDRKWSLDNVDFRLLLNKGETRTTIQPLLRSSDETCSSFHDSEFSQLTKDGGPPLLVVVPRPRVSIGEVKLSRNQDFVASGTAENLLEHKEGLCIWVSVRPGDPAEFAKSFLVTFVDGKNWRVSAKVEVRSGDKYIVEVGLVPPKFEETVRPKDFAVLDWRVSYVQ